jgi:predicted nuclease with TOPRIM domain
VVLEASLGELEDVQQRLADNERQMKAQIDELTEELKANQDPNRMQLIQEMISVWPVLVSGFSWMTKTMWSNTGTAGSNVSHTGEGI